MTEYTQEFHDRLRELDKTASPAPWYIEPYERMVVTGDDETGEEIGATYYGRKRSKKQRANKEMLTDARNAVPVLLAEIERLQAEVKKAELAYGRGMSDAMVQFYGEELPKAKRLAWDECATKAHEFRVMTETADKLMQANPYRKKEK